MKRKLEELKKIDTERRKLQKREIEVKLGSRIEEINKLFEKHNNDKDGADKKEIEKEMISCLSDSSNLLSTLIKNPDKKYYLLEEINRLAEGNSKSKLALPFSINEMDLLYPIPEGPIKLSEETKEYILDKIEKLKITDKQDEEKYKYKYKCGKYQNDTVSIQVNIAGVNFNAELVRCREADFALKIGGYKLNTMYKCKWEEIDTWEDLHCFYPDEDLKHYEQFDFKEYKRDMEDEAFENHKRIEEPEIDGYDSIGEAIYGKAFIDIWFLLIDTSQFEKDKK